MVDIIQSVLILILSVWVVSLSCWGRKVRIELQRQRDANKELNAKICSIKKDCKRVP